MELWLFKVWCWTKISKMYIFLVFAVHRKVQLNNDEQLIWNYCHPVFFYLSGLSTCLVGSHFHCSLWNCFLWVFLIALAQYHMLKLTFCLLLSGHLQPPSGHRWLPVGQVEAAASGQCILCSHCSHRAGLCHPTLCWEGQISHQGEMQTSFTENYNFFTYSWQSLKELYIPAFSLASVTVWVCMYEHCMVNIRSLPAV